MNYVGMDVSKGKSNVTIITSDFELMNFSFKHNVIGFKKLSKSIDKNSLVIFEITGVYSAQITKFLRSKKINFIELNPLEAKMRMSSLIGMKS